MFKTYVKSKPSEYRIVKFEEIGMSHEDLTNIGVSSTPNVTVEVGDMIGRDPLDHNDQWLVKKKFFEENFTLEALKTLHNTTSSQAKDNVSDLKTWGNSDMWKLLSKASSQIPKKGGNKTLMSNISVSPYFGGGGGGD